MSMYAIDDAHEVEIFRALGDPTRLRILKLLTGGELCVCQIERALKISQTLTSRHLSVLRMTGLVRTRKQGQWVYYSYNQPRTAFEKHILTCIKSALPMPFVLQRDVDLCNQVSQPRNRASLPQPVRKRRSHANQP
jgi:ArsR family transcriptional regulator